MKNKIINEILIIINELDKFNLLNIEGLKNYINFRDQRTNDKIYPEWSKLILAKAEHDEAVAKKIKIINSLLKEILFDVGKCDVTAAIAVEKVLNEFKAERLKYESTIKEQNNIIESLRTDRKEQNRNIEELKNLLKAKNLI